jgi:ribosomal protein S18 acetylase RimI-like enzyme
MSLRNLLTLTVRTLDFNLIARQPVLLEKLRKLTLSPYSGLNCELDRMLQDVTLRPVECQVLLAYRFRTLVGWGILSKETTNFRFSHSKNGFKAEEGKMFQVFVDPAYRRQGIATELFKEAQKMVGNETLCICPWDERSEGFYNQFPNVNTKRL